MGQHLEEEIVTAGSHQRVEGGAQRPAVLQACVRARRDHVELGGCTHGAHSTTGVRSLSQARSSVGNGEVRAPRKRLYDRSHTCFSKGRFAGQVKGVAAQYRSPGFC